VYIHIPGTDKKEAFRAGFKILLLSFRRRPESREMKCYPVFSIPFWTPAFAGVTVFHRFEISS
jgi:hypothetical protein